MHLNSVNVTKLRVFQEIVDIHLSCNELLRHFWSNIAAGVKDKQVSEKLVRIADALQKMVVQMNYIDEQLPQEDRLIANGVFFTFIYHFTFGILIHYIEVVCHNQTINFCCQRPTNQAGASLNNRCNCNKHAIQHNSIELPSIQQQKSKNVKSFRCKAP